jgi:hypothetical protein
VDGGSEITIRELVAHFAGEVLWDPGKPDGQPLRCYAAIRARRSFAFVARTPLREGPLRRFEWEEPGRDRAETAVDSRYLLSLRRGLRVRG